MFSLNKTRSQTSTNFGHLYLQRSTSAWHPQQLSADNDNYRRTTYLTCFRKSLCECWTWVSLAWLSFPEASSQSGPETEHFLMNLLGQL